MTNAYNILLAKHGRKIPLSRHGRIWDSDYKYTLEKWNIDWIQQVQDRQQWQVLLITVINH
jgi:hypothetical protein